MSAIVHLASAHLSRYGRTVLDRVDLEIFCLRYFTHCMQCTFCHDSCCAYGVDVDRDTVDRILAVAPALEAYTGSARDTWFTGVFVADAEVPGGAATRTRVVAGPPKNPRHCVFLDTVTRGCKLHRFSLDTGRDYHDLKPMVSVLFPVTFDGGLLHASDEVADGTLVCSGSGPSLYTGCREELRYYFGDGLIAELDAFAAGSGG